MNKRYDLSQLLWKLAGFTPNNWLNSLKADSLCEGSQPEVAAVTARVPGSVQQSLLDAGVLPEWNYRMNSLDCEWVENRHWAYEASIPDEWLMSGSQVQLTCMGLDYSGWLYVNDTLVSEFKGAQRHHIFTLGPSLRPKDNKLRIIFDMPPRYLGYTGFTSKYTDWKARFSYSWDWMVRLVTLGIWDDLFLSVSDGQEIQYFSCTTDADVETGRGKLSASARLSAKSGSMVEIVLKNGNDVIRSEMIFAGKFSSQGLCWDDLPVELWWPNLHGEQPLYSLECILLDEDSVEQDRTSRNIGFRNIKWAQCEYAPDGADPWICVVNGKPIFLQGVNWTPIRPNFHDLSIEDYRKRLEIYRDMGLNIFRVWGGAILEKEAFYDLCDEMGFMVWQEFPLSSATFDNWPPEDPKSVLEMTDIATSYIERRAYHASLIMWCGGNELFERIGEGSDILQVMVTTEHPMMRMLDDRIKSKDSGRRFIPTSPGGPRFFAKIEDFGKSLHWNVHGPYRLGDGVHYPVSESTPDLWEEYWKADDALFRAEIGCPSASSIDILETYCDPDAFVKPASDTPTFRRQFDGWWWAEWASFEKENRCEPQSLKEFVEWSQTRQAKALSTAVRACKERFPRCGGFIIWMGHDCFPCSANTAIIDFIGTPKAAVSELKKVFTTF